MNEHSELFAWSRSGVPALLLTMAGMSLAGVVDSPAQWKCDTRARVRVSRRSDALHQRW